MFTRGLFRAPPTAMHVPITVWLARMLTQRGALRLGAQIYIASTFRQPPNGE